MKNTFVLINRTPPDVLSLIPNHWEGSDRDVNLIKLTHVCHGWRELFTSRPLLWTSLDCTSANKTEVYIERSKSCPLEISLKQANDTPDWEDAFVLTIPHIGRLRSLSVSGNPAQVLPVLVEHFSRPMPLLNNLKISTIFDQVPNLPDKLLDGDLSSLHELSLSGVVTPLPWRDLSNLTTFNFCHVPEDGSLLTQLLDFFESAHRLHHIHLHNSIPKFRGVPPGRVVPLPRLKELSIVAQPPHSILLDHLSIPIGASLRLEFAFSGGESPILSYLPKSLQNLHNLSHVTATNIHLGPGRRFMRLNGPSGELYILGNWTSGSERNNLGTSQFFRSLDQFDISRSQRLAITLCNYHPPASGSIEKWEVYRTLRSMEDLRTLTLGRCNNLPFILTLDPNENSSKTVLCPKLEDITLYIKKLEQFRNEELLSMARARASRGAKLSAISIICLDDVFVPTKEVFQLREHVSRVEYKFDDALPGWDTLPVT